MAQLMLSAIERKPIKCADAIIHSERVLRPEDLTGTREQWRRQA
jgi:hypothetical protein